VSEQTAGESGGLPESLRAAIERTLEATARSATTTRERAEALVGEVAPPAPSELRDRAVDLLDEVAKLGQETGHRLAERGRVARQAMSRRVEEMRPASEPSLQRLAERVEDLDRRLAVLERGAPQSEVEG
jgi:polyhydroxyalkanoate synthesis regulator phasin